MTSLENRVAKLEAKAYTANLAKLTDAELDEYILTLKDGAPDILTLEGGSPQWWDAVLSRVARHPSAFPIISDEQAYAERE